MSPLKSKLKIKYPITRKMLFKLQLYNITYFVVFISQQSGQIDRTDGGMNPTNPFSSHGDLDLPTFTISKTATKLLMTFIYLQLICVTSNLISYGEIIFSISHVYNKLYDTENCAR